MRRFHAVRSFKSSANQLEFMVVDAKTGRKPNNRGDWGATRVRMVSRFDRVVNWARRGRSTRESHAHHHEKTKRMQR